ncbi:signal transduction histidine kinase [Murinocardiopsis flavida]|uniref:histidine kinase n=1 Tax=Murinocardiopsis flavida TaxID=645275 RepID=A0A2P8CSW9_9ACTN|nr:histidine kinase [Murinocardiopsis flavida]PSK88063.1 signal transduction histidine kinase [Murinocardiopsis flavida]
MRRIDAARLRATAVDVLIVGAAAVAGFAAAGPGGVVEPYGGAAGAGLAAAALPLALRRRFPVGVAWVSAAALAAIVVVEAAAPGGLVRSGAGALMFLGLLPAAPFAAYSAGAFAGGGRAVWPPLAALAVLPLAAAGTAQVFEAGVASALTVVGAAAGGLYAGARRRLLAALLDRAERAERERFLRAEQARGEERARIAAEIHDVVTHRVSLMVLQAGALGLTSGEAATRDAAEGLRATGCQALEELRDVVGVLRGAEPPDGGAAAADGPAPPPVPPLSELVAASEAAGLPVAFDEVGAPDLAAPVIGRTVYRIVQEALTNAHKHAPGADTRVRVRYRPDGVRVDVSTTASARGGDPALARTGGGTGLLGLRRRVELVGGVLRAGPAGDGGFRVDAALPADVPAAAGPEGAR